MKKLLVFPTWVLMKMMQHFLRNDNSLKGERITLTNWAKHSNDLNDAFSAMFWVCGVCMVIVVAILHHMHIIF